MKFWTTELNAIDQSDGKMKSWVGPPVPGLDFIDACLFVKNNNLGYLKVMGEFLPEVMKTDSEIYMKFFLVPIN